MWRNGANLDNYFSLVRSLRRTINMQISIRKIIKVFNIYELDLRFQISKPFRVTAKTIDELKNIVLSKNICS